MKRIVLNRYTLVLVIILFLFNCKSSRVNIQVDQSSLVQNTDLIKNEHEVTNDEAILFAVAETRPVFFGDSTGLYFRDYICLNLIYPVKAHIDGISGRVVVEFTIDVDGSVTNATVIGSVHPLLDAEALRVINSSPKWTPGMHEGKPVRIKYVLPVYFYLPTTQSKR